ncbi:MAG: dihydropteroate synthase [Aestuariivirgaceae bacterium]
MTTSLYLRPVGLCWGEDARQAVAAGCAGRLAGLDIAFTEIELIERDADRDWRSLRPYADLAASTDAGVAATLARLAVPRPDVAGLRMDRSLVMGIINVTPDSFSDGGEHADSAGAIAHGVALAREGAAILDVGGESTRPYSEPAPVAEERWRAIPVIAALAAAGHCVSADSRKAAILEEAVTAGARILNDVSALTHDPASLGVAARSGLPIVLMHALSDPRTMQDDPRYRDVALDIYDYLEARLAACETEGIPRARLIADPGIGFGKTHEHNMELMRQIALFHGLGVPLLVGASRKGFIGTLTGETEAGRRGAGSVGAALTAAMQGAQIIRVHDVRLTRHALNVWAGSFGMPF